MEKLKNNLGSIAALLGTISAIAAGFIKYGELTTTIDVMQETINELNARQYVINETVDLTETNNKINDNYETTLDRISDIKQSLSDNKNNLEILKTRLDLIDAQLKAIESSNKNPLAR